MTSEILSMCVFVYVYKTEQHGEWLTYFFSCSEHWPTQSGNWRAGKADGAGHSWPRRASAPHCSAPRQ